MTELDARLFFAELDRSDVPNYVQNWLFTEFKLMTELD